MTSNGSTTLRTALAAGVALLALAGCSSSTKQASSGVSSLSQGVNHPSDAATPSASDTSTDDAAAADESTDDPATDQASPSATDAAPQKFGTRFTYADGLVVVVGKPTAFTPSDTAAFDKSPAYVKFKVTLINGSKKPFDPSLFSTTAQSGNTEASEVVDVGAGLDSRPSTNILAGRESVFSVAFGVANAKDIVLQVTPSFEYDPVIFTS